MRLLHKKLLLLVSDGVEEEEVEQLKKGFEEESAQVFITAPQEYLTIETVSKGRRGKDLRIDLPFEALGEMQFDGLIIPDGLLSTEMLRRDKAVLELIFMFNQNKLPIFASGNAVELLYESKVLSEQIVIREGTPLSQFFDQAVDVLLDQPSYRVRKNYMYRPAIV